ncbi:MAG: BON domain-containing protein [Thermoanaerobaculia bacterium]
MKKKSMLLLLIALTLVPAGLLAADDEMSTAWITAEKVKAAMLDKGAERALPIEVTMDRTTAILTGEVESKIVQELATEVALSVEGVAKVDNRLHVVGEKKASQMSAEEAAAANEQELQDARLESSAKLALYKEIGLRARKIEVEAVMGVVSLRGSLPDAPRKQIALETVTRMKDVKKVIDLIKIGD